MNSTTERNRRRRQPLLRECVRAACGEWARWCDAGGRERSTGVLTSAEGGRARRNGRRRGDLTTQRRCGTDGRRAVRGGGRRSRRRGLLEPPQTMTSSAKLKPVPSRFHSREEELSPTSTAPAPRPASSGHCCCVGFRKKFRNFQRTRGNQGGRRRRGGGGCGGEKERDRKSVV